MIRWPDNGEFTGSFLNGKKNGKGKMTFATGDKYTGEFFENEISGEGEYVFF